MRKISIVPFDRKDELRKYLNEYLIELSEFDTSIKIDKKGIPSYKYFDCYWTNAGRYPIYLKIDDLICGFALVRKLEDNTMEIGEFCVFNEYRKDGNATWFAQELISFFDSNFTFSTRHSNIRAMRFWEKFVSELDFTTHDKDNIRTWNISKIQVL